MNIQGRLAQSVRAPASHAGGQRFESSIAHQIKGLITKTRRIDAEVAER